MVSSAVSKALFFHGYRRFTEDVNIVVTAAGLQQLHQHLEGLGYVPLFPGSREGLRFLGLVKLVELKLASGTSPGRRKDLGDVQELIRRLKLSAAFAEQLNPSVRATYHELWIELQ